MKKKWWIIALAVAAFLALAWLIWRIETKNGDKIAAMSAEETVMAIRPYTVMVTAGEMHASGVIYDITDSYVMIITAGHLMEGFDQGIVTFYTGDTGFGDVCLISQDPDISVLKFKTEFIEPDLLSKLSQAPNDGEHYDDLKVGDKVYLVGSAVSSAGNAVEGSVAAKDFYVDDFDARMLYLYTDVMAGMSGCGVYDEWGYLVGILAGGSDQSEAVCVSLPQIYETEELLHDKD